VLHGVRVDLQRLRESAHGRERVVRFEHANRHAAAHLVGDLAENRPWIGGIYVN
jgi:hypothetical protein